jgi:hypothetical protein
MPWVPNCPPACTEIEADPFKRQSHTGDLREHRAVRQPLGRVGLDLRLDRGPVHQHAVGVVGRSPHLPSHPKGCGRGRQHLWLVCLRSRCGTDRVAPFAVPVLSMLLIMNGSKKFRGFEHVSPCRKIDRLYFGFKPSRSKRGWIV